MTIEEWLIVVYLAGALPTMILFCSVFEFCPAKSKDGENLILLGVSMGWPLNLPILTVLWFLKRVE